MNNPDLYALYANKWQDNVELCKKAVERNDLTQAEKIASLNKLQQCLEDLHHMHHPDQSPPSSLVMLPLLHINSLTVLFVEVMGEYTGSIATSLVWGWIFVTVKLCASVKRHAMETFSEMLKDIGDQAQLLTRYHEQGFPSHQMLSAIFDMKIEIDNFLVECISHLHRIQCQRPVDSVSADELFEPLQQSFRRSLGRIRTSSDSVYRLAQLSINVQSTKRGYTLDRAATLVGEDDLDTYTLQLPLALLPTNRNPRFFGRQEELQTIGEYLEATTFPGMRSCAIHGLGGVGKTQTALAYAWSKVDEYDVVVWLHAETEIALSSSLGEFAQRLRLPGAAEGNNTSNALLALEWLQHTDRKWLLIYDNAEAEEFLKKFWPTCKHGSILMTTRNRNLSVWLCSAGFEIKVFSSVKGASFLLHLMAAQDLTKGDDSAEVVAAAIELSDQVGGHALALTQVVGLMSSRQWSLPECLSLYATRPKKIHSLAPDGGIDSDYKFFINTVFREALTGVKNSISFTLLGILSFLVPDGIPQELFEPSAKEQLPSALSFCMDSFDFDDALKPLLRLALVKKESKEPKIRSLSLHRLVQKEFSFFVEHEERQRIFDYASLLLYLAFPQRVAARFLHSRWPECEKYIQHVITLVECCRAGGELANLRPSIQLCYLLTNSAWYIHELGTYEVLERFLDTAFKIFAECDMKRKEPLQYAKLATVAGVMWDNWGQFEKSTESFMECLRLCEADVNADKEFLAGTYNDLGNVAESMDLAEQAITWHKKSWEIRAMVDDPTGENVAHSKSNIARALLMLDRDEEAKREMDDAEFVFNRESAWFHEAHVHFCKGNLCRKQRDFITAKQEYNISLTLLIEKVKAPSHVRTGANFYKLGSIAIEEGDFSIAAELLTKALSICDIRKQNVTDRARILNKLAEALVKIPGREMDGKELRIEALGLYHKLALPTKKMEHPGTYDFDLLVCGLHR